MCIPTRQSTCRSGAGVPARQSADGPARSLGGADPRDGGGLAAAQPASAGADCRCARAKGEVVADYLKQRVAVGWCRAAARCWYLLVRREVDGAKLKFACPMPSPGQFASPGRHAGGSTLRGAAFREDAKGLVAWRTISSGLAGVATTWPW